MSFISKTVAAPQTSTTPASGCSTAPFAVEIKDIRVYPVVAGQPTDDVNCSAGPGAGTITATQPLVPTNFTYSWRTGNNFAIGTPVLTVGGVNGEVAQSLQEGDYTVEVKDNATGCPTYESFIVANNPT